MGLPHGRLRRTALTRPLVGCVAPSTALLMAPSLISFPRAIQRSGRRRLRMRRRARRRWSRYRHEYPRLAKFTCGYLMGPFSSRRDYTSPRQMHVLRRETRDVDAVG